MREIKFRAWRPKAKEMVSPRIVGLLAPKCEYPVSISSEGVYFHPQLANESKGIVLMQFTGLKDKNGVEIYEGDVVGAFCDTQRFEIKYCEERGGYFLDGVVLCGGAEPAPECLGNLLNTVEVIGNIHDNPELLEGGESK